MLAFLWANAVSVAALADSGFERGMKNDVAPTRGLVGNYGYHARENGGLDTISVKRMEMAAQNPPTNRLYRDNPDVGQFNMIHFIYAVPQGGVDRGLDLTTTIPYSVSTFNRWLATQTGGRVLMLDTYHHQLDITFVHLPQTDQAYQSYGVYQRDNIESDLHALGWMDPTKIYVVYYEGGHEAACADAPHPPELPGQVVVIYLHGLENVPGVLPCAANSFAGSPTAAPGYWEYSTLHEIIHAHGIVSATAPHYTLNGHVSDSSSDLMYAGSLPWAPSVLDFGRDDYYNPSGLPNGIVNFANSPFLSKN
jgi:hypothetical protein